ncbi:cupin domain-containing protein [Pelagibacterium montanilacus]|uniref:cupin domain-containing protein n=1 Tax=Pelagibacterium montanilacus TaxID=2185280 RepID=UPI001FE62156|nr:cupin domain-containing protein [Pelagibacterium montanilacus]
MPLTDDSVSAHVFADDGTFPNSALPLMAYRRALAPSDVSPEAIEALFAANSWPPAWRYGIYPDHHYHSNAHEALGVASGTAEVTLGGPDNGLTLEISAGDVVVIPAGVAHKCNRASDDFLVVGAYPPGQSPDLLWGKPGDREKALPAITDVPLPESDPVKGPDGPLVTAWARETR